MNCGDNAWIVGVIVIVVILRIPAAAQYQALTGLVAVFALLIGSSGTAVRYSNRGDRQRTQ